MLGVVSHVLQVRYRSLRSFDEAQVLAAVEGKVALDEAIEVIALLETYSSGGIPKPAMELGSDAVEILGLRAFLTLADLGGVLAAEPCLEAVGLHLLACIVEFADTIAPARVGGCALRFVYVGEQVAPSACPWD